MRRTTITILAITLSASAAACGGAAETVGEPTKQHLGGERGDQGAEGSGTTASGSDKPAEPTESTTQQQEPGATEAPKPAQACDSAALNNELSNMQLETALQQHDKFRCLCDDQGYPLVGNINAKGTKASEFCPTLKEKGLL